jgi:uncharacterized protein (TIGR02145 family)
MKPTCRGLSAIVRTLLIGSVGLGASGFAHRSAQDQAASHGEPAFVRMADGTQWTAANLHVSTEQSYCYNDVDENCGRYGRLYTWAEAQRVCRTLGDGWRLPTDDEWRRLAKQHGGMHDDAADGGKAAYAALVGGGSSGFEALLGGGRLGNGQYVRLEAHGLFWTASETGPDRAVFYNFGKDSGSLYRQPEGDKLQAFSVRCFRDQR